MGYKEFFKQRLLVDNSDEEENADNTNIEE